MKISFFGASVTQQKGYVDEFKKKMLPNNNINVYKHGYGSMHLNDAGVCCINKVLENNPNYLFIEWFVTGYTDTCCDVYLDTIINKCANITCVPVFLLLDRTDIEKRVFFNNKIKEYATTYNIHYIEIVNIENREKYLRDAVHTTELGGHHYADIIYNYFITNVYDKEYNFTLIKTIPPTIYSYILHIDINKTFHNNIIIEGNCEIIGIYQKIGPYSGVCEINYNNNKTEKCNLWDQWCYFERNNIKLKFTVDKSIKINILQEEFDTSSAKVQNVDNNKKMTVHTIFYLGNISKVDGN
jgi:hypothetical protein